tara:strand:+ start:462 stop:965 length:504 start_codon:yes stop_codon:yes gene_type:complete
MAIYYGDGSNSDSGNGRCIQRQIASTNTHTARSNNAGWSSLGGLSINITPKQNNHKILIEAQVPVSTYHNSGGAGAEMYINRSVGGSNTSVWEGMVKGRSDSNDHVMASCSIIHLDNPQTTSTITYTLYGRECHGNTQADFNGTPSGSNFGSNQTYTATLLVTEVAT